MPSLYTNISRCSCSSKLLIGAKLLMSSKLLMYCGDGDIADSIAVPDIAVP